MLSVGPNLVKSSSDSIHMLKDDIAIIRYDCWDPGHPDTEYSGHLVPGPADSYMLCMEDMDAFWLFGMVSMGLSLSILGLVILD